MLLVYFGILIERSINLQQTWFLSASFSLRHLRQLRGEDFVGRGDGSAPEAADVGMRNSGQRGEDESETEVGRA